MRGYSLPKYNIEEDRRFIFPLFADDLHYDILKSKNVHDNDWYVSHVCEVIFRPRAFRVDVYVKNTNNQFGRGPDQYAFFLFHTEDDLNGTIDEIQKRIDKGWFVNPDWRDLLTKYYNRC